MCIHFFPSFYQLRGLCLKTDFFGFLIHSRSVKASDMMPLESLEWIKHKRRNPSKEDTRMRREIEFSSYRKCFLRSSPMVLLLLCHQQLKSKVFEGRRRFFGSCCLVSGEEVKSFEAGRCLRGGLAVYVGVDYSFNLSGCIFKQKTTFNWNSKYTFP